MKKRSKEILDLLGRRENDHTISTLAAKFEVSERTIRNDIKDINDYLKEQEIKPIRFGSNGLIVMEEDIQALDREKSARFRITSNLTFK